MKYLRIVNDKNKNRVLQNNSYQLDNMKIMGLQDFFKSYYFDYNKEAVVYIQEKYQVTLEIAEIYLNHLYYITKVESSNEKFSFLKELKRDLDSHKLLQYNPFFKNYLKTVKIEFYHLEIDKILENIIKELEQITRVTITPYECIMKDNLECFESETLEMEINQVFQNITNLIKSGVSKENIYISNLKESDYFLVQKYSYFYHLPINFKNHQKINSTKIVHFFRSHYELGAEELFERMNNLFRLPKEVTIIEKIIQICNSFSFEKSWTKKKSWIFSELEVATIPNSIYKDGINEIDFLQEEVYSDSYVIVCNCNEGSFPNVVKEEGYFTEEEYNLCHLSTISEINKIKKEQIQKLISFYKNIKLFYHLKDGKEDKYKSHILENFPLNITKSQNEFCHSRLYNQLTLGKLWDDFYKYGVMGNEISKIKEEKHVSYLSYKNEFKSFPMQSYFEKHPNLKMSYSSLDQFFHCSFRYYLNQFLHLNVFEESFEQKIGNMIHHILEKFYQPDFHYEEIFQNMSGNLATNAKESFFLEELKKELASFLSYLKDVNQNHDYQTLTEETLEFSLPKYKNVTFKGILDKIYWKEENGKTKLVIVDYKTGNPSSSLDNLKNGLNLQLPIYLYLLDYLPFKNIEVVGFYYQKILSSLPNAQKGKTLEELKRKNWMLDGYSTSNQTLLSTFDDNYSNSKMIRGMKTSMNGFYPYTKVLDLDEIQKIKNIVSSHFDESVANIQAGEFAINPKRLKDQLIGCDYCKYQSICYMKEENIIDLEERKWGASVNANMDERTE